MTAYCGGLPLRGVWLIIIQDFIFADTAVSLYSVLVLFQWSEGSLEHV